MPRSHHAASWAISVLVMPALVACAATGVKLDEEGPFTREELERRIERLDRITERRPDDAGAWYALGNAYFDSERFNDARRAYRRVVELNPERADAWSNLGLTHRIQGNFINAINAYETALEIEPDDTVTLRNLSILMQTLGHLDASTAPMMRLLELEPDDPAIRNELAELLVRAGRYEEALTVWEEGGGDLPTAAQHDVARATALMGLDRLDEAARYLDRAASREPANPLLPPARADLFRRMGEYDAAWREVDQSQRRGIPLDPGFVELLRAETDNAPAALR